MEIKAGSSSKDQPCRALFDAGGRGYVLPVSEVPGTTSTWCHGHGLPSPGAD